MVACASMAGFAAELIGEPGGAGRGPAGGDVAPTTEVDALWRTLEAERTRARPPLPRAAGAGARLARENARIARIADHRELAERLRAFRAQYPEHSGAKEAKRLEALELLDAAYLGDADTFGERERLVADVRADRSIESRARAEVAARHENLAVMRRRELRPEQRLAAFEAVERRIMAEFPDSPDAFESLLQIAKHSSDERAAEIARELQEIPAPEFVKRDAWVLLQRTQLVGQPLPEALRSDPAVQALLKKSAGRPVIVYAWSTANPTSQALGRRLAETAPADAALVAVNLDADARAAKVHAARERLPGEQCFRSEERPHPVALGLYLTQPGLAVAIGADGIVRTASAQRDPAAAMASLTGGAESAVGKEAGR